MQNLDEKIYDLLKQKDKLVGVSEIENEITDVSKRDILKTLQILCQQNQAYRKVIEGKAYFSINSENGESRNPNQQFISNMQTVLNKATKGIINDVSKESEIFEENDDSENIEMDYVKLEYTKNKKFENEKYEILIPDSFEVIEEAGRDFVAYLKNPNLEDYDYNEGGACIIIYPSHETPYIQIPISEPSEFTYLQMYDFSFWSESFYKFKILGGDVKYFDIKLENNEARLISNGFMGVNHFYFLCCIKGAYKQIHIEIKNIKATFDERKDIAIKIMNKFKCKDQVGKLNKLNDKYFLDSNINDEKIEKAISIIKRAEENLNFNFRMGVKTEESISNVKQTMGELSIIDYKKRVRKALRKTIDVFEEFLKGAYEFILKAKKENVANEKLKELYCYIKKVIDNNKKLSVDFGEDEKLIEESAYAKQIYNEMFNNEILKLIETCESKELNTSKDTTNSNTTKHIDESLKKECEKFITGNKNTLEELKDEWESLQEGYIDDLGSRMMHSEEELKYEMRSLKSRIESYGDTYEKFIIDFDRKAKKYLDKGADCIFIKHVKDIIDDTFEAIEELSMDITTSGTAYLDLGKLEYSIPSGINRIKEWWNDQYNNNPEVKKANAARLEEMKKRREERNNNIKKEMSSINGELTEHMKEWKEELEKINEIKNKELEKFVTKKNEELASEREILGNKKEKENLEINSQIQAKVKENEEINVAISKLNVFQFFKKEQLKEQLNINNQKILEYKNKLAQIEQTYIDDVASAKKNNKEKITEYEKELSDRYICPESPEKIIEEYEQNIRERETNKNLRGDTITKRKAELKKVTEEILRVLEYADRFLTVTEIQVESYKLENETNQRISACLKGLVDEGKVIKVIDKKKTYFKINEDNNSKERNLIDAGINTTFAKDRERIYKALKANDEYITLQELNLDGMSEIRINQVINSLILEKRVLRKITDEIRYLAV